MTTDASFNLKKSEITDQFKGKSWLDCEGHYTAPLVKSHEYAVAHNYKTSIIFPEKSSYIWTFAWFGGVLGVWLLIGGMGHK